MKAAAEGRVGAEDQRALRILNLERSRERIRFLCGDHLLACAIERPVSAEDSVFADVEGRSVDGYRALLAEPVEFQARAMTLPLEDEVP